MEKLQPSKEWNAKYEEVKELLTSPVNYAECFEMKEIQGKEIFVLDMGEIKFPTGEILVRDPLVWLNRNEKPYLTEDSIFGFNVDAGLATIVDVETRNAYCDFEEKWNAANPGKNIYDDFFAEIFAKSAKEYPLYQRDGGDWINFKIPNSELSIPMIQSGFGDGRYPVYFGYDANGGLCDIVCEYIYLG